MHWTSLVFGDTHAVVHGWMVSWGFDDYTYAFGWRSFFVLFVDAFYCLAGAIGFGIVWYTFLRVVIDINHAWRLSTHLIDRNLKLSSSISLSITLVSSLRQTFYVSNIYLITFPVSPSPTIFKSTCHGTNTRREERKETPFGTCSIGNCIDFLLRKTF